MSSRNTESKDNSSDNQLSQSTTGVPRSQGGEHCASGDDCSRSRSSRAYSTRAQVGSVQCGSTNVVKYSRNGSVIDDATLGRVYSPPDNLPDGTSTKGSTYAVISGGRGNTASGECSVIRGGENCHSVGKCSTVGGGSDNQAIAEYSSVAGGEGLRVSRKHGFSTGRYNVDDDSLLSVGYGTSDTERVNVFTVNEQGDVHITGTITCEQIQSMVDRIEQLEKTLEQFKRATHPAIDTLLKEICDNIPS